MFTSYLLNLFDEMGNRLTTKSVLHPVTHAAMHFKEHPKGHLTIYREPYGEEYLCYNMRDLLQLKEWDPALAMLDSQPDENSSEHALLGTS